LIPPEEINVPAAPYPAVIVDLVGRELLIILLDWDAVDASDLQKLR